MDTTPRFSSYETGTYTRAGDPSGDNSDVVIRSGFVNTKEGSRWLWNSKWLVLKEQTLSIHKSKSSPQQTVISLSDISNIQRGTLRSSCLILTAKNKRYFLSFANDGDLYDWQGDIYSRSPLMNHISLPYNFTHHVHVGFDPVSGSFTGMPREWANLLTHTPPAMVGQRPGHSTLPSVASHPRSQGSSNKVIRSGLARIKRDGGFACKIWRVKWLVLNEQTLSIHRSESSAQQTVILLRNVSKIERTDLKPCCLLLETNGKQFYLSFQSDGELYDWQDDIYSRSPLNTDVSVPHNFRHKVHVGFDPVSGSFSGMPAQWSKLLAKTAETREDYAKDPQAVLDVLEFYRDDKQHEMDDVGVVSHSRASTSSYSTVASTTSTFLSSTATLSPQSDSKGGPTGLSPGKGLDSIAEICSPLAPGDLALSPHLFTPPKGSDEDVCHKALNDP